MRVRDHIAISTPAAVLSHRWLGRNALALWAGAVLIDADHYLAFCLQERRASPAAAMRFYGGAATRDHWATRAFHSPAALLAVLCLGARVRGTAALAFGMGLHVMLDHSHEARMNQIRAAALKRDQCTCQACGTRATTVGTHVWREPWLLPSYRVQNVLSLCPPCHVLAHAQEHGPA
jgi:hypothetical protein